MPQLIYSLTHGSALEKKKKTICLWSVNQKKKLLEKIVKLSSKLQISWKDLKIKKSGPWWEWLDCRTSSKDPIVIVRNTDGYSGNFPLTISAKKQL